MDTGKQALTKPQKKVGVPQKKGEQKKAKAANLRFRAAELVPRNLRRQIAKGGYRQVRQV